MLLPDHNRGLGRFESSLRFEQLPAPANAGPHYVRIRLTSDLVYMTNDGLRITVPCGFECDGASIPPAAEPIVGAPLSTWNAWCGVLHDWLYRCGEFSKAYADVLLYDAARCAGATDAHAGVLWEAVDRFGQSAFDENARKRLLCRGDLARLLAWA